MAYFLKELGHRFSSSCKITRLHQHKNFRCCPFPQLQTKVARGSQLCHNVMANTNQFFPKSYNNQSLNGSAVPTLPSYADTSSHICAETLINDMLVINDFISETEEKLLLEEVEPYMARLRYEYTHWDDAILGYRETERSTWNAANTKIINRLKDTAFDNVSSPTNYVHVLDLEENGEIKPHKDSIRYCGNTIAGISLLSDSVMRLVAIDNKELFIDVLLKQRSLYIMRQSARYDYTHEILHNDKSYFKEKHVKKGRRISVICRNSPVVGDERHKDS
ncbi:alpha-ketoglutarate-dependent dioxygenase alkB homolog 7, mitochondrial-like [Watersipora subatra]|uniref:alpha-ketoglutarate-dependent dioxygenase alkB homolog 7, mitochondrial-like n=1 Tax=Watersipora subatra TaxID=2589382 RepID=UPI00355B558B